jgi:DNA-binding NtrC family response regulator
VLERALLRSPAGEVAVAALEVPRTGAATAAGGAGSGGGAPARGGTLEDVERDYLEQVLREEEGSVERAAARLGISKSAVYYKARKHQIALSSFKD